MKYGGARTSTDGQTLYWALAREARAQRIILLHHDPTHDDSDADGNPPQTMT